MSILTIFFSPFSLVFLINIIGSAIGKIRFKRISLGAAGILFAGILLGFLTNLLNEEMYSETISNAQSAMKTFSKLGSSLFVSVIGLQTGFSIKKGSKESALAFAIGTLMSISGVMVMLLISAFDKTISYSSLLGILCGALTSTPGLSSVCESITVGVDEAVWAYGCSYLFGVILAVLFSQMLSQYTNQKENNAISMQNAKNPNHSGFILVSISSLLGNLFGNIYVPFLNGSLGITACTLIFGIFIGNIVRRYSSSAHAYQSNLNSIRHLGLALFFAGTGFATGTQSVSFDIKPVLYGTAITLAAILCGWLLCKSLSNRYSLHNGFIIAGGMTSSPAFGSINHGAHESLTNCFSFSYFGALISLIISIQLFLI